jgi:hypothetical protein
MATTKTKAPAAPTKTAGNRVPGTPVLKYLRTQPLPTISGTIPATARGGTAGSQVVWNPSTVPEIPAWASAIDLSITVPISVHLATGKKAHISPYAPYCMFQLQSILAGAPEWPNNTSLVPFWLDWLTHTRKSIQTSIGPDYATQNNIGTWFYKGPTGVTWTSKYPGSTLTGGSGGTTFTWTWKFTVRIRLQVKPNRLWGCIPLGDPQNRPRFPTYLTALVGPNPENNLLQGRGTNATSTITAKVGSGGVVIKMTFRSLSLDVLPTTVKTLPAIKVGMGRQVGYTNSLPLPVAGSIVYQQQRLAQIYTAIYQCLVNKQAPINPDYIGLWITQAKASARWTYDKSVTTLQNFYKAIKETYGRYLPVGVVPFVLDGGFGGTDPEYPREAPYNGLMSPDAAYAAQAVVKVTPNMSTAVRIPSGTSITSCYSATYTFGLIKVPY